MNAAKAITLAIFGDSDDGTKIGTLIYFAVAVIISISTIFLQINFVKSEYYLSVISRAPL
jgi:hypothetical protein